MNIGENRSAPILKIHPDDNVLVALKKLPPGISMEHQGHNVKVVEEIPAKHNYLFMI